MTVEKIHSGIPLKKLDIYDTRQRDTLLTDLSCVSLITMCKISEIVVFTFSLLLER